MACRQLGLDLKIIGDGSERTKLEAMADETVTFTGELEAKEVRNILCSAAVLCVPSRSEGFANVYLEAAACGTPIVGYGPNVDELSSTIGMSIGIGTSPEAGSKEVRKALEMRHSILSQFDPVAVAGRYLDLMTEIVDQTQ
jgi:glycosyltransferase involved in cell wall biosynthesis